MVEGDKVDAVEGEGGSLRKVSCIGWRFLVGWV